MKKDVKPVVKHLKKDISESQKGIREDKNLIKKQMSQPAKKAK